MDIAPQTQSDPACCSAADVEAKVYRRLVVDYEGENYIRVIVSVYGFGKASRRFAATPVSFRVSCQSGRIICEPFADRASRQHERRLYRTIHRRIESAG